MKGIMTRRRFERIEMLLELFATARFTAKSPAGISRRAFPRRRGAKMVSVSFQSSAPTGNSTDPPRSATNDRRRGHVNTPRMLAETVIRSATAKFPLACIVSSAPELMVHGAQKKTINPSLNSGGEIGMGKVNADPSRLVHTSMEKSPKKTVLYVAASAFASSVLSFSPPRKKITTKHVMLKYSPWLIKTPTFRKRIPRAIPVMSPSTRKCFVAKSPPFFRHLFTPLPIPDPS
mmetsp:Transcript_9539/g.22237  ORF Transcript_9539/g.22237 Transcript_9539/m.22237 type:complete len:233 (-) Transcript_9539:325-1023(-)